MSHDQLFKDLLRAFFADFLALFLPDVAAGIDPDAIDFLDTQTFTDVPEGALRIADVVARVQAREGTPTVVLLHTEVQTQREADLGQRMWVYNASQRLRSDLPVISVAIVLSPGTPGLSLERYGERLFGHEYPLLEYWQIGLRDLPAADYVHAAPDLAAALAALMRPGPEGRPGLKAALLRRLRGSDLNDARVFLLVNAVETYLRLEPAEEAVLREALRAEGDTTVETTEMTWADEMMARGREQGREQGLAEGLAQVQTWADEMLARGREQGLAEGLAQAQSQADEMIAQGRERGLERGLLRVLRRQFGVVPDALAARLDDVHDSSRLEALYDVALSAASLDEFARALDDAG